MKIGQVFVFVLMSILITNCAEGNQAIENQVYDDVKVVSAMKNVMWKGELGAAINLDTISNKKGLYGIGPETFLTGELLINDGKSYVSKVLSDSTMIVQKTFDTAAPFFVYANVNDWEVIDLPKTIKNIKDVELLIEQKTKDRKRPFAFKLIGKVESAIIHIQNLPPGTAVSSPAEAHQGQVNYSLGSEEVEIIGFFSTEHQAVFTHHDTYVHLHLMTKDESKMGHLDEVIFDEMKLYLPKG